MSVEQVVIDRFLVVNCENSPVWSPITVGDMMVTTFGAASDLWDQCIIANNEELPVFTQYKGVVITGSRFNVRDNLPWYGRLKEEIVLASERGTPKVFGGCFGHQFISYALGGSVDFNLSHKFCLTAETIQTTPLFYHHLKEYYPKDKVEFAIKVIESHGDSVIVKPTESILLGTSVSCENEILLHGAYGNLLSAQSHPEFEYKYAIEDRIWKFVVEKNKRISPEDAVLALKSFQDYNQPQEFIEIIQNFLHC